jgi:hypothetical protein
MRRQRFSQPWRRRWARRYWLAPDGPSAGRLLLAVVYICGGFGEDSATTDTVWSFGPCPGLLFITAGGRRSISLLQLVGKCKRLTATIDREMEGLGACADFCSKDREVGVNWKDQSLWWRLEDRSCSDWRGNHDWREFRNNKYFIQKLGGMCWHHFLTWSLVKDKARRKPMRLADAKEEDAADCPRWCHNRWNGIGADGPHQQVIV